MLLKNLSTFFRYDNDQYGRNLKYWNVVPSEKSLNKVREKLRCYLKKNGHRPPQIVAKDLNAILRGWINNFTVDKVSYPAVAKRKLRYYLSYKLYRFYKRKSQRKCKLYSKSAMEYLIEHYGFIDPSKYIPKRLAVKA